MKTLLGFLCFILLSQGVGGLLYELTGGRFTLWALAARSSLLDGYEICGCLVLIVAGLSAGRAAATAGRRTHSG